MCFFLFIVSELLSNGKNADAGMAVSKNMDLASMIRHQNWSGVIARLEINPEEAEQDLVVLTRGGFTATTGFTPLHFACERRPPVAVVEALISACPRAITARAMPGGALPLHVACTWYAPVGVINALILADRNGCKTQDELGNFPLHAACFSGTSPQVFDTLLRAYPKAVLVRNHQGSLPEEITKRLRHDERKAILVLLDVCKQQVLAKREKKHKKNRDDAGQATSGHAHVIALNPQSETGEQELVWV
jgi:Ankyrin repeat